MPREGTKSANHQQHGCSLCCSNAVHTAACTSCQPCCSIHNLLQPAPPPPDKSPDTNAGTTATLLCDLHAPWCIMSLTIQPAVTCLPCHQRQASHANGLYRLVSRRSLPPVLPQRQLRLLLPHAAVHLAVQHFSRLRSAVAAHMYLYAFEQHCNS